MVYDRGAEEDFDVFKRMNEKIRVVDVDRRQAESALRVDVAKCLDKFEEYSFIFGQNETLMRSISRNIDEVSMGLHELRDYVNLENERFLASMTKVNSAFVEDLRGVRVSISEINKSIDVDKYNLVKTDSKVGEEIEKLKAIQDRVHYLEEMTTQLQVEKCNKSEVRNNLARVDGMLREQDLQLSKLDDQFLALD
jgi:hypothetical protein